MFAQNSYTFFKRKAIAGQLDSTVIAQLETMRAEETITFGFAVVRGTNKETQVKLPSAANDKFLGVSIRAMSLPNLEVNIERVDYRANEEVSVLRSGTFWSIAEQDVEAGDPLFYRHTVNGANVNLGKFRKDDDGGNAKAVTGAIFDSNASAGEVVKIKLSTFAQQ